MRDSAGRASIRNSSADASNGFVTHRTMRDAVPPALRCRPMSFIVLPLRCAQTATLLSERCATPIPRQLAGASTSNSTSICHLRFAKNPCGMVKGGAVLSGMKLTLPSLCGRCCQTLRKTDIVTIRVAHKLVCAPTMRPFALRTDWLSRRRQKSGTSR